ncbi:hypothetical protein GCM10010116_49330 [Microbispora rosea subsp. aerata]|nr:hypothetical protein GCM10010116_49330 [Microbispora rosea subsp. aerata]GIH58049.1 hypothetical protein Mro02_49630 [Microbispora rosea subsp. aerata]
MGEGEGDAVPVEVVNDQVYGSDKVFPAASCAPETSAVSSPTGREALGRKTSTVSEISMVEVPAMGWPSASLRVICAADTASLNDTRISLRTSTSTAFASGRVPSTVGGVVSGSPGLGEGSGSGAGVAPRSRSPADCGI